MRAGRGRPSGPVNQIFVFYMHGIRVAKVRVHSQNFEDSQISCLFRPDSGILLARGFLENLGLFFFL